MAAAAAPPRRAGEIQAVSRVPKTVSKGNVRKVPAGGAPRPAPGQRKPFDASPYTQYNSMQKI